MFLFSHTDYKMRYNMLFIFTMFELCTLQKEQKNKSLYNKKTKPNENSFEIK